LVDSPATDKPRFNESDISGLKYFGRENGDRSSCLNWTCPRFFPAPGQQAETQRIRHHRTQVL
jgi:hypothetical protein